LKFVSTGLHIIIYLNYNRRSQNTLLLPFIHNKTFTSTSTEYIKMGCDSACLLFWLWFLLPCFSVAFVAWSAGTISQTKLHREMSPLEDFSSLGPEACRIIDVVHYETQRALKTRTTTHYTGNTATTDEENCHETRVYHNSLWMSSTMRIPVVIVRLLRTMVLTLHKKWTL
jgi:hypothetical protein